MRFFTVILSLMLGSGVALGQSPEFTFVFLNKNPDAVEMSKEETDKLMQGHMANINKLASEGKLLAAGPFHGGGGIFILKTRSEEEAREWLKADPGVRAQRWNIEYHPYRIVSGGVCTVSEPYEMVTYSFIRYTGLVSKFNAGTYPALLEKHSRYLQQIGTTSKIVTIGSFDDQGSGILVLGTEVEPALLESDPAVQEGLLTMEIKKLYIARGSFCEK